MKIQRLVLVLPVVLSALCLGQEQTEAAPNVATVSIIVSTTFGEPVGKALAILRAIGTKEEYRQLGETVTFQKIPFGRYEVEIQSSGFSIRHDRVGIYGAQVHLWYGLFPSRLHSEEPSEIAGSLTTKSGGVADLWVRLVPWYSSDFLEDKITSAGTFRLAGVDPGRYVLFVIDKDKLIATKSVEYFGGKLTLNLDLTK